MVKKMDLFEMNETIYQLFFNLYLYFKEMLAMEVSQSESGLQMSTLKTYQQLLLTKRRQEFIVWVIFTLSLGVGCLTYQTFKTSKQSEDRRIWILNDEISVKRWNENMLKKLGNLTYNEFPKNQHYFSQLLNDRLIKYYREHEVKKIADFGCGKCEYVLNLNTAGFSTQGFDGHPWNDDNSSQVVKKMDLSQNVSLGEMFDYVQSFEVGEHIYSDFQDNFIYNIVSHARKGIILSWGIVGQIGYLHVNNRDNDYIISKVEAHGFTFIQDDVMMFRKGFVNHFANTLMIFHKN